MTLCRWSVVHIGDGRDLHNVAARPTVVEHLTDASLDIPTLRHIAAFD